MAMAIPAVFGGLSQIPAGIAISRIKEKERIQKENDEKIKELKELINSGKNKNNGEEKCCCGNNEAPCRRNFNVFIFKSTKKEAYETALHWPGARSVVLHYHNKVDNIPHFHPTFDFEGKIKIPGIHIQFPK